MAEETDEKTESRPEAGEKGAPGSQRGPQERADERAERRRAKAAQRSRRRPRERARRSGAERGSGTPPADREPGVRKVRVGTVVSARAPKTVTVRVELVGRHPRYEKVVRTSRTLHAHDEHDQAEEGDTVRVIESRPLSRTKRWRLLEVVERAR